MTESTPRSVQQDTRLTSPNLTMLPSCLFAPESGARSLFAKDGTGVLLHISAVETGVKGLCCPDCGVDLIAKKGKIKILHFAHVAGEL